MAEIALALSFWAVVASGLAAFFTKRQADATRLQAEAAGVQAAASEKQAAAREVAAQAALDAVRLESRRQEIDEAERHRAHARAVSFDFDWRTAHDKATAIVSNNGPLPIRNCRVLTWRHDSMGHEIVGGPAPTVRPGWTPAPDPAFTVKAHGGGLGDIQPGGEAKAEVMTLEPHAAAFVFALVFADADDRPWRLWHDGTLEDLTKSALTPQERELSVGAQAAALPRDDPEYQRRARDIDR